MTGIVKGRTLLRNLNLARLCIPVPHQPAMASQAPPASSQTTSTLASIPYARSITAASLCQLSLRAAFIEACL